jgi:hypothetical protein
MGRGAHLARTADKILALDTPVSAGQLGIAHSFDIAAVHTSAECPIAWQV